MNNNETPKDTNALKSFAVATSLATILGFGWYAASADFIMTTTLDTIEKELEGNTGTINGTNVKYTVLDIDFNATGFLKAKGTSLTLIETPEGHYKIPLAHIVDRGLFSTETRATHYLDPKNIDKELENKLLSIWGKPNYLTAFSVRSTHKGPKEDFVFHVKPTLESADDIQLSGDSNGVVSFENGEFKRFYVKNQGIAVNTPDATRVTVNNSTFESTPSDFDGKLFGVNFDLGQDSASFKEVGFSTGYHVVDGDHHVSADLSISGIDIPDVNYSSFSNSTSAILTPAAFEFLSGSLAKNDITENMGLIAANDTLKTVFKDLVFDSSFTLETTYSGDYDDKISISANFGDVDFVQPQDFIDNSNISATGSLSYRTQQELSGDPYSLYNQLYPTLIQGHSSESPKGVEFDIPAEKIKKFLSGLLTQ